jgi:hypothetical protein
MRTTMPPGFSLAAAFYFMAVGPRALAGGSAGVKDAHGRECAGKQKLKKQHPLTLSSPQFVASRYASQGDPGFPRCQCACGHAWGPTGKKPSETVPGEKKLKTLSSGKKHHPLTKKPKKKVKINRGAGKEEQDGRGLISEGEANASVCVLMRRTEESTCRRGRRSIWGRCFRWL